MLRFSSGRLRLVAPPRTSIRTPLRSPAHALGVAGATTALLLACASADRVAAPAAAAAAPSAAPRAAVASGAPVVISQVYGGGGNSGATYKNDFIELYNPGTEAVSVAGWSVQYASASGTNWQVTPLSGSIAPGGYYLIQQAAGAGGTTDLPTPDASGSIAMSGTGAKVALVAAAAPLTGACPLAATVDFVGYGSANCFEGSNPTLATSNPTAAIRNAGGNDDDNDNRGDFTIATPTPRNSGNGGSGVTVGVTANPSSFAVGGTSTLTATVTRNGSAVTPSALVWSVSPEGRVTFSGQSGNTVTATGATAGGATVTATATVDGQTYTGTAAVTVNAPATALTVEGYSFRGSDPLPVGFQELYRARPAGGSGYIRSGIVWSTSDAAVATVDALGNVTAVANGTVNVIATETATGRTGSAPLTVATFTASDPSVYADELQFGTPADATPNDEILVDRATFAASWNRTRGQPNWVAYNLEATHRTNVADRCDCFTPDPLLPADAPRVTSADYDNSNFSRGHMTMSADRTRGALDNAQTFYFTNIIPQTNQNNAGPWLGLEQYLGDLARNENKEIFIVAGGARYEGSLKGEGRVAIPTRTWKVAVILDRDQGVANVRTASDVRVIAVDMPNTTTVPQRTADWPLYQVSVDSVEALTGYDVLSALPDALEAQLEAAAPATRAVGIDMQPERVSVASTPAVTVVLYSGGDFDATTAAAPAALRLVVDGAQAVAPITRGATVNTSTRDVNGDGRLDRVISFSTAALRAAGLRAGSALTLVPAGATPAFRGADATPPVVAP